MKRDVMSLLVPEERAPVWIGDAFGRLTVSGRPFYARSPGTSHGKPALRKTQWVVCKCSCGKSIVTACTNLKQKNGTISCGCYKREKALAMSKQNVKHGGCRTRLYGIWIHMRSRCSRVQDPNFPRYGGRGIKVCDEWDQGFDCFRDWALANGYKETDGQEVGDRLTLDRVDVDGPYAPWNCEWIPGRENSRKTKTDRDKKFSQLELKITHLELQTAHLSDQLQAAMNENRRLREQLKLS